MLLTKSACLCYNEIFAPTRGRRAIEKQGAFTPCYGSPLAEQMLFIRSLEVEGRRIGYSAVIHTEILLDATRVGIDLTSDVGLVRVALFADEYHQCIPFGDRLKIVAVYTVVLSVSFVDEIFPSFRNYYRVVVIFKLKHREFVVPSL